MQQLAEQRLIVAHVPEFDAQLEIVGSFGNLNIRNDVAEAVFASLKQGPQRIADLAALPVFSGKPLAEPIQAVTLLLHAGHVVLEGPALPIERSAAFNDPVARAPPACLTPYGHHAARPAPPPASAHDFDRAQ